MSDYIGIVYNDETDGYGVNELNSTTPEFTIKGQASANLNIQEIDEDDILNAEMYRNGYPEPEGTINLSVHTRSLPTILYGLTGNYAYYEGQGNKINTKYEGSNVHQFWIGENLDRPQFSSAILNGGFDLKTIVGAQINSLSWDIGLEKSELEVDIVYRTQNKRMSDVETFRQTMTEIPQLPLVGYDYALAMSDVNSYGVPNVNCLKNVSINIENNLITGEDARCLGHVQYMVRPTVEELGIEIEGEIRVSKDKYDFITGLEHNGVTKDDKGVYTYNSCQVVTKKLVLHATPCDDSKEGVRITIPKARVTIDPIDWDGTNVTATIKLSPYMDGTVKLVDGTTIKTPLFFEVMTEMDKVLKSEPKYGVINGQTINTANLVSNPLTLGTAITKDNLTKVNTFAEILNADDETVTEEETEDE